jgi:hypothetical protein
MRTPVGHCYCGEAVTCRVLCGIYPDPAAVEAGQDTGEQASDA